MRVSEVVTALGLQVRAGEAQLEREVTGGCVSDLLSQVMGTARAGQVWITVQVHPNIVGVAALLDLAAVIVTGELPPEEATLEKAREQGVTVLSTTDSSYAVAGKLYALGVR